MVVGVRVLLMMRALPSRPSSSRPHLLTPPPHPTSSPHPSTPSPFSLCGGQPVAKLERPPAAGSATSPGPWRRHTAARGRSCLSRPAAGRLPRGCPEKGAGGGGGSPHGDCARGGATPHPAGEGGAGEALPPLFPTPCCHPLSPPFHSHSCWLGFRLPPPLPSILIFRSPLLRPHGHPMTCWLLRLSCRLAWFYWCSLIL